MFRFMLSTKICYHIKKQSYFLKWKFLFKKLIERRYTARSIEIVPRGGPPIFRFMLMYSRGGPPILGLYVDEF